MNKIVKIVIAVISVCCALILLYFLITKTDILKINHDDPKIIIQPQNISWRTAQTIKEPVNTINSDEIIETTTKLLSNLESFQEHKNYKLFNNPKCGIHNGEPRIIRGFATKLMANPWMVALIYLDKNSNKTYFNCAGTLISENLVLTAAHCINEKQLIAVRLGDYNLATDPDCTTDGNNETTCADKVQEITDFKILKHEYYHFRGFEDIALIKLNESAKLQQDNINTICLPFAYEKIPMNELYIVGWGRVDNNDTFSNTLLGAFVPFVEIEECRRYIKATLTKAHICAGGEGNSDSCKGDSGGPLTLLQYYEGKVRTIQFGIVSYGPQGGCGNAPAVYTRVYSYLKWILDNA